MPKTEPLKNKISKRLSWVLRHGAQEVNLKLDDKGWADLADILALPQFKEVKKETIFCIVADCPKQRFAIKSEENRTFIKANQGHSIEGLQLELTPVLSANTFSHIYHGTYYKCWSSIQKRGLHRMNRVHIHFTPSLPDLSKDSSGIRKSSQIVIELNVEKLLAAGFKLWQSKNDVILCEGNDEGLIPSALFHRVIDLKTGQNILTSSN